MNFVAGFGRWLSQSTAARAFRYGYSNARTKAMRSTLLGPAEYAALIEAKGTMEVIAILERTAYGEPLREQALISNRADLVEIAASRHFSKVLKKLLRISPKGDREKIHRVYERYDLLNLKNLLYAKHLGEAPEKTRLHLVESPNFNFAKLDAMVRATGVNEVVEATKGTDFFPVLNAVLEKYQQTKEIAVMVDAAESQYYRHTTRHFSDDFALEKSVQQMLAAEIDAKNIMTVLRGISEKYPASKIRPILLEGGTMARAQLEGLLQAESVEDALKKYRSKNLTTAADAYQTDKTLSHFENALEKSGAETGLSVLRRSSLSLTALVGFLLLKEEEIRNIRKIVRAKEFGFSPEATRELVVGI